MRLSDAMSAGSMVWQSHRINMWNMCALGTAANAVGIPPAITWSTLGLHNREDAICRRWPWLESEPSLTEQRNWLWIISDMFEVGTEVPDLVEFIRAVEPKCDCNRFDCECQDDPETAVENSLHPQDAML